MYNDQESIVYGCIKDVSGAMNDQERRKVNARAMGDLPDADDWPFLCRDMFSTPVINHSLSQYHTDVMHFGASYKAVEYEWEEWLAKFEDLLSGMYWVSATVHLETELSGTHTFTWESNGSYHAPGNGGISVRCEWSHEGGLHV